MIDFITGDPVQLDNHGGQLHLAHVHDVAEDGEDVDRITLTELRDLIEVAASAAEALDLRARRAAQLARCGRPSEEIPALLPAMLERAAELLSRARTGFLLAQAAAIVDEAAR